jgi:CRP-like cAMP-binding protein
MAMISPETLRRFRCFGGVSDESLKEVALISEEQDYLPGDVIFRSTETAEFVYLVLKGEVDLKSVAGSGERRVVDTIVGGELLGWSVFVAPYEFRFHGIARNRVRLIAMDALKLRSLMDKDHTLGFRLMSGVAQAMGHRLEGARVQIAAHAG